MIFKWFEKVNVLQYVDVSQISRYGNSSTYYTVGTITPSGFSLSVSTTCAAMAGSLVSGAGVCIVRRQVL